MTLGFENSLTHTLDPPPYIGLETQFLVVSLLIGTALLKPIIPLSKELSIVFARCSRHTIELRSRINSLTLDEKGISPSVS